MLRKIKIGITCRWNEFLDSLNEYLGLLWVPIIFAHCYLNFREKVWATRLPHFLSLRNCYLSPEQWWRLNFREQVQSQITEQTGSWGPSKHIRGIVLSKGSSRGLVLAAPPLLAAATPCLCPIWESELISASFPSRQWVGMPSPQRLGSVHVIEVSAFLIVDYGTLSWCAITEMLLLSFWQLLEEAFASVPTWKII